MDICDASGCVRRQALNFLVRFVRKDFGRTELLDLVKVIAEIVVLIEIRSSSSGYWQCVCTAVGKKSFSTPSYSEIIFLKGNI